MAFTQRPDGVWIFVYFDAKFLIYFRATTSDVYIKKFLQTHTAHKANVVQLTIKTQ